MFLKPHRREKKGVVYEYWTLEESVRRAKGPRHRRVATLAKLPGLDEKTRVGWEHIAEVLDGRSHQLDLLHEEPAPPQWARVDTSRTRVERLRKFGEVYLGLALWRRLKLDAFFDEAMARGREEIAWGTMACFLALVLWRTLQFWMQSCGLGTAPRKLIQEMAEVRSLDVILPTDTGREIRLRTVSRPDKHLAILLDKLQLPLPTRAKSI